MTARELFNERMEQVYNRFMEISREASEQRQFGEATQAAVMASQCVQIAHSASTSGGDRPGRSSRLSEEEI